MNSGFALQEVGRGGISPAEPIAAHLESRDVKPCYSELSPGQGHKTTWATSGSASPNTNTSNQHKWVELQRKHFEGCALKGNIVWK